MSCVSARPIVILGMGHWDEVGEVSRNAKIDSGTRKRTEITVTGERSLKTDNGKKCRWKIEDGYIFNGETDKAWDKKDLRVIQNVQEWLQRHDCCQSSNCANGGKAMNPGNDSAESFNSMLLSLQNNECRYTEFQFLLTSDLSSLKRSGVSSKSVKRLLVKHTYFALPGFKIRWAII